MDYHEQLRLQYEFSINVNSYQNPRAKSATFPLVLSTRLRAMIAIVHDRVSEIPDRDIRGVVL